MRLRTLALAVVFMQVGLVSAQQQAGSSAEPHADGNPSAQTSTSVRKQLHTDQPTKDAGTVHQHSSISHAVLTPSEQAWNLLDGALTGKRLGDRLIAIHSLGLIADDTKSREIAEKSLADKESLVRAASASALGDMKSTSSIAKLKKALDDKDPTVALAAAHSLQLMHDESGYEAYAEILSGDRKGNKSLIASQSEILKDKKKMAMLGLEQGIGFIPYAGIPWEAYHVISKNGATPIRATAAKVLETDPNPAATKTLEHATGDKNWMIRAAALESLAKRGDPAGLGSAEHHLTDEKTVVRFNAAAAVVRLSAVQEVRLRKEKENIHEVEAAR